MAILDSRPTQDFSPVSTIHCRHKYKNMAASGLTSAEHRLWTISSSKCTGNSVHFGPWQYYPRFSICENGRQRQHMVSQPPSPVISLLLSYLFVPHINFVTPPIPILPSSSSTFLPVSPTSSCIMGFPSVCYCVILPKPLLLVVQLVDLLKFVVSFTISCLGLCPPQEDSAYPSPASAVHPSVIKRSLPIVEFSTPTRSPVPLEGDEAVCAVCLGTLEEGDEVRELGNCCHAFHRLCIDKWVDMGRVTCPLCRTQLLPRGRAEKQQLVMAVEFM